MMPPYINFLSLEVELIYGGVIRYHMHGTFRPVNVLQVQSYPWVQWHTRGDAADAEQCARVFQNILDA